MDVYTRLALALPVMSLLAFGCAQVLSVVILRRRFMLGESTASLQRRLHVALYAILSVCVGLWGYVFVICARAVWRETMSGNLLPLPLFVCLLAMAFAALVTVSWFAVRQRTKDLARLSAELQVLSRVIGSANGAPHYGSQSPVQDRPLTEKARHAVLFLGAPSYRSTLELLQKAHLSSS